MFAPPGETNGFASRISQVHLACRSSCRSQLAERQHEFTAGAERSTESAVQSARRTSVESRASHFCCCTRYWHRLAADQRAACFRHFHLVTKMFDDLIFQPSAGSLEWNKTAAEDNSPFCAITYTPGFCVRFVRADGGRAGGRVRHAAVHTQHLPAERLSERYQPQQCLDQNPVLVREQR